MAVNLGASALLRWATVWGKEVSVKAKANVGFSRGNSGFCSYVIII